MWIFVPNKLRPSFEQFNRKIEQIRIDPKWFSFEDCLAFGNMDEYIISIVVQLGYTDISIFRHRLGMDLFIGPHMESETSILPAETCEVVGDMSDEEPLFNFKERARRGIGKLPY